jgi:hypothetical protein
VNNARNTAAVAIAVAGLAAAGCSAVSHAATGPVATPVATTSPSGPASASPPAAVPTLGRPTGVFAHGQGFGQVRPAEIFNGGDPTGLVTHVVWKSWGGARAVATGISDYVGPNQSVAEGRAEPAAVVAFKLGTCDGRLMYRAVEWYFPQHGQAFDARRYEDVCTGIYVPGVS